LLPETSLVAFVGLFGGIILGLAVRLGRFCTLGALADIYCGGNAVRLRMWGIAVGMAISSTYGLSALGYIDLSATLYLSVAWNPWANIFGGLLFGYGMALAGNCGFGALARLSGGDLRAFMIVMVMGLSAYITISGPLAYLRIWIFGAGMPALKTPSIPTAVSTASGLSVSVIGATIGLAFIIISLASATMWRSKDSVLWGAVVGLAITSGWVGTQWVASNGFEGLPVVSHTFSAPIGESLLYLMTASANSVSFATRSVLGVLIGSFLGSLINGHFRWEACDDPRELGRQIFGAAAMGVGSVSALSCSVGQGLSAFSVLAYSAPVTLLCIMLGAGIGLRQLIHGFRTIS
jgi:hypothetical protein